MWVSGRGSVGIGGVVNTGDLLDDRFRLRERLGVGGMSVVWRAQDEVLGRDVAVKVLSPHLAQDQDLLARIRAEARAVARLRHPNIVDVYDYGEAPGPLPYVVMEVVEGRSLSQLLSGGALTWRLAVLVGAQVAAALAAAHERSVVHRDVKPGNVVVSGARVKLVDFGISALSGDEDRAAGQLLGTPAYLAPERLENGVVRPATDVYALGLLLHRALAGQLPWQASTATQMLIAHRYQEPTALPRIAGLPAEVAALCRRCLAKDPGARPTAAEAAKVLAIAAGLNPAVLELPGATTGTNFPGMPAGSGDPTVRVRALGTRLTAGLRHRRRAVAVTGAAGLLLAGVVAAVTLPGDPTAPAATAQAAPVSVPTTEAVPQCTVGYVVSAGAGRFTARFSVANTGAVAIPAAPLTFTLPGRQTLSSGAPGSWRQNGSTVTAKLADLAPGTSHAATIRGTYQGSNELPDRFRLNGTACQVVLSVAEAAADRAAGDQAPAGQAPVGPAPAGPAAAPEPVKATKTVDPAKAAKKAEKAEKKKEKDDEDEDDDDEE
ncbi:serine/threonine-protein kinase [Actinoplanes sp. GCM10030250]|uniref:serine/threonine-protein kinase n=1 Tax=Actinoplanes sp. GCM10030250 TaxID=3273376 RepID=UPI003615A1B2